MAKRWAPRDGFPEEPLDNYMDVSTDDFDHDDHKIMNMMLTMTMVTDLGTKRWL